MYDVGVANGMGKPAFKVGEGVFGPLEDAVVNEECEEACEREPSEPTRGDELPAEEYAWGGVGKAREGNLSLAYTDRCAA